MRHDGRKIKSLPGFFKVIPFIMSKRSDSQNLIHVDLPLGPADELIKQRKECRYTHMSILAAAYIRTICSYPDMNRFVVNKRIYARRGFTLSFIVLKSIGSGKIDETAVKVEIPLDSSLDEVHEIIERAIKENRGKDFQNSVDDFVSGLMRIPLLPSFIVSCLKFMDKHSLMPKRIIDLSPFHTSLFVTNMASLNMNSIYHHLYEFGTTTVFAAMGKRVQTFTEGGGKRSVMPVGVVTDERICPGFTYSNGFKLFAHYFTHPELLLEKAAVVKEDIP